MMLAPRQYPVDDWGNTKKYFRASLDMPTHVYVYLVGLSITFNAKMTIIWCVCVCVIEHFIYINYSKQ